MPHFALLFLAALLLTALAATAGREPIRLHPDNPHYFLFRGKPTILITSAEHYGAVLNLDFDYTKYLDALQRDGMNNTRTFLGLYVETQTSFGIARNTLAPPSGRLICPWARSDAPGYTNGGNKFDLSRWDDAYFRRLRDFVAQASDRGIIIEVNLFCPFYDDSQWALSPMNAANNINGLGQLDRTQTYSLTESGELQAVQERLVRKLVAELAEFDNLYYEIMNEPYWGKVTPEWQARIAEVIAHAESGLPHRHLISQNIANGQEKVEQPDPRVSVLNFHYAWPPETVALNYDLGRVIGDNETGFKGTADAPYRLEAWAFILAGGALLNHLDYSFTAGHEGGDFAFPPEQPGGGGPTLRRQFGILRDFITGFDFLRMKPAPQVLQGGLPQGVAAQVLAETGKQYAIYLCRNEGPAPGTVAHPRLDLPAGCYRAEWLNPLTGSPSAPQPFDHPGGEHPLTSPAFDQDIALRIVSEG